MGSWGLPPSSAAWNPWIRSCPCLASQVACAVLSSCMRCTFCLTPPLAGHIIPPGKAIYALSHQSILLHVAQRQARCLSCTRSSAFPVPTPGMGMFAACTSARLLMLRWRSLCPFGTVLIRYSSDPVHSCVGGGISTSGQPRSPVYPLDAGRHCLQFPSVVRLRLFRTGEESRPVGILIRVEISGPREVKSEWGLPGKAWRRKAWSAKQTHSRCKKWCSLARMRSIFLKMPAPFQRQRLMDHGRVLSGVCSKLWQPYHQDGEAYHQDGQDPQRETVGHWGSVPCNKP